MNQRTKFQEFKYHHNEAWLLIKIATVIALGLGVPIIGYASFDGLHHANLYPIIEGLNCGQLSEYIADQGDHYGYAEHRYEWLCVNEQVKEFQ